MKALIDYIMEGHKQKLENPESFLDEIMRKYGKNTPEYYKAMTDFFIKEILWKFPEIKYLDTKTEDRKDREQIKDYTIEYSYKNHVLGFQFSTYWRNYPTCRFFIDGNDVTFDIGDDHYSGLIDLHHFMSKKSMIDRYKKLINALR